MNFDFVRILGKIETLSFIVFNNLIKYFMLIQPFFFNKSEKIFHI